MEHLDENDRKWLKSLPYGTHFIATHCGKRVEGTVTLTRVTDAIKPIMLFYVNGKSWQAPSGFTISKEQSMVQWGVMKYEEVDGKIVGATYRNVEGLVIEFKLEGILPATT
jgi:hypothetical protein